MKELHPAVAEVTRRIRDRSAADCAAYLSRIGRMANRARGAERLGCANVAHAFSGAPVSDRLRIVAQRAPDIAVINAHNDMLSAHAPYGAYPVFWAELDSRFGGSWTRGTCRRRYCFGDVVTFLERRHRTDAPAL